MSSLWRFKPWWCETVLFLLFYGHFFAKQALVVYKQLAKESSAFAAMKQFVTKSTWFDISLYLSIKQQRITNCKSVHHFHPFGPSTEPFGRSSEPFIFISVQFSFFTTAYSSESVLGSSIHTRVFYHIYFTVNFISIISLPLSTFLRSCINYVG
jgi:hypothetical protein